MKTENNGTIYLHLLLGSIGILLIALGMFELIAKVESTMPVLILTFFGFGFIAVVHYIYYLEKKAGISNKLIWIRAVFLILLLLGIYFSFYN
ncbi:hypothetical protein ACERII_19345 [Evansella sp. AB-rgal1]|uniref:hypothetical protein n=1 Tax=Evansella sp. AB-rgal1 TaxID=3242696 RepID=UPI00359DBFF2